MLLTTVDSLKTYLGVENSNTNDDMLEELIGFTSGLFESYCNRQFELTTYVYSQYPLGEIVDIIYLNNTPVLDITTIMVDGSDVTSSVGYKLNPQTGKMIFTSPLLCDSFEITYRGGYERSKIPSDLQFACNVQVAFFYQRRDTIGLRQVAMEGSYTTESKYELLTQVKNILGSYRVINV